MAYLRLPCACAYNAYMSKTKLIRVNGMSDDEWRRLKAKAAMLNVSLGDLAADALRAVLKGAKP